MNKGLIKSTYINWLLSNKQILTAVAFICLYMYTITPILELSEQFSEPINILEPFITIVGNMYCIPIVTIAFLITIIDFPDICNNVGFVLIRTGRRRWYLNQIIFLICAIITYLVALLIFSLIFTSGICFVLNGWSNVVRNLQLPTYEDLSRIYAMATIDLSILNNFRPYPAFAYSIILAILQLMAHGQLQIHCSMRYNRVIGICTSVSMLGLGLALWTAGSDLKWIFPFSNSTIGWHYDNYFNEALLPLWISFTYLIILNIVIYILGQINIKKKQMYLEVSSDD